MENIILIFETAGDFMRVVEVISDTNIGGAGILLLNRLSCTDLEKYSTVAVLPKGSMLTQKLRDIGVKCNELCCEGDRSFDVKALKMYVDLFKAYRPDIVNCHGCLSARIAAKICRVPVKICTRHCVFPVKAREKVLGTLNNALSDHFIAVAHSAKENLVEIGVDAKKISVIINGSRALRKLEDKDKKKLRDNFELSDKTTVLGFCARLEPCKGHEWFMKTVKGLSDGGIDFKVLLIGDGTQRQRLMKISDELGIRDKLIFCGFVDDVAPLMNIVDINVNCSIGTETSSLALSEGMSLGLPAVVSDYGGNPYMIRHGINGFVCPQGDHSKMAEYIKLLINDKRLYENMSYEALKRFENELNAESMAKETNRLYDELYQAHHRA